MADKKIRPRTRPRVESTEPKSSTTHSAQHRSAVLENVVPIGYTEITVQSSELVPVAQFANVTVGPVAVRMLVQADSLDDLKAKIQEVQNVVDEVIAEDRELVEASVRLHNLRAAEEEKEAAKGRG